MPCPALMGISCNPWHCLWCQVSLQFHFNALHVNKEAPHYKAFAFLPCNISLAYLRMYPSGSSSESISWLMPHLMHTPQHKACLKIPCLLKTHCTRGVELCLQGIAAARCCFITWKCQVSQYWLLNTAGSHSLTAELCTMHFLTISTPFTTRSCYKRFWNVNTLQARLPETTT